MAEPNPPAPTRAGLHVRDGISDDDAPRASDRFERALFDSARADVVPTQARERVALALGIEVPPGGTWPGAAEAMMHARSGEPVAGSRPRAAVADGAGAVAPDGKLAFVGKCVLVALAGGLAALALGRSNPAPAPVGSIPTPLVAHSAPGVAAQPAEGGPVVLAPPASAEAEVATTPEPRETRSVRKAARPGQRSPRAAEAAGESRLLAEVARLDQARAALAAADAPGVLQHVARYRAEFPNGVLSREAARLEERGRALEGGSVARRRDIERAR